MVDMSRNFLHVSLIRASAAHKKSSRKNFQQLNLTEGQPRVLSMLREMEGCHQNELASACHVEPATMTSLLRNMEQSNLIFKEKCQLPGGKRAYSIYLTEHGKKSADEVMRIVEELEKTAFEGFSEEEEKTFLDLFSRVTENLENKDA